MNIIINLNKDPGITSHDAVTAVKKLFKVKKAGHAGTLDPTATGVLLICLNEATKITGYLSGLDKEYVMTAKLGESTDTYDSEGKIIERFETGDLRLNDIERVIQKFVGEIEQIPPMHSAIKVSGRPLYRLARKGIEVQRSPRMVKINSIEILKFGPPFLTLKISCSKGTYIRSLCNDIGNALGVGAHVVELIRTKIGDFTIENSARINELPHKTESLYSMDSALKHLPELSLQGNDLRKAKNGNPISYMPDLPIHPFPHSSFIRLKDPEGRLFGIGKVLKDSIKIERLLKL